MANFYKLSLQETFNCETLSMFNVTMEQLIEVANVFIPDWKVKYVDALIATKQSQWFMDDWIVEALTHFVDINQFGDIVCMMKKMENENKINNKH